MEHLVSLPVEQPSRWRFVVVYDFVNPSSRSHTLAAAQIANFARHLGPSPRLNVTALCVGPVPTEVATQAAGAPRLAIVELGAVSPPVPGVVFSNKLHAMPLMASGDIGRNERVVLIDHDVFFIEAPRLPDALPPDAVCSKLDPLRRISNADWRDAERLIGVAGVPGRFVPPMHLTGHDEAVASPASHHLYFNSGLTILPVGTAAYDFLAEARRIMAAIKGRGIVTPAIAGSDQFAFSVAAAAHRIVRLEAAWNFQANNILEGYRPVDITAVHFAGNNGASLPAVVDAFLGNMLDVCAWLPDPAEAARFAALSRAIARRTRAVLCGGT